MKQIVFPILFLCGISFGQIESLEENIESYEDFERAAEMFYDGEANSGKGYFSGVLAEVILIDIQYQRIEVLDLEDAPEHEIMKTFDACLEQIIHCRTAIKQYSGENWPKKSELNQFTFQWISHVEAILNEFAKPLAKALAKPDDEWTDEELALYDDWVTKEADFLIVDDEWVDFQAVYAEANGFSLDENATIDVQGMAGENE